MAPQITGPSGKGSAAETREGMAKSAFAVVPKARARMPIKAVRKKKGIDTAPLIARLSFAVRPLLVRRIRLTDGGQRSSPVIKDKNGARKSTAEGKRGSSPESGGRLPRERKRTLIRQSSIPAKSTVT